MTGPGDLHYPRRTPDDPRAADELARTWVAASERAFGTGLHEPAVYHRTTRLVAAVTAELRTRGRGVSALVAAWPARLDIVRLVVDADDRLTTEGLDLETVAGAAFAMRYREALAESAADDRLAKLAAAPAGTSWLVLEESGYAPGDPFVPYRRLEVDARTGRALLVTTLPDDSFSSCVHRVEEGVVDLATGELGAATGSPAPREFGSSERREAAVADLKADADG